MQTNTTLKKAGEIVTKYNSDDPFMDEVIALKRQEIENNRERLERIGIEKGKREGKREGLKNAKQEIAKNLLKLDISIENIIKSTGLDENTIKSFVVSK